LSPPKKMMGGTWSRAGRGWKRNQLVKAKSLQTLFYHMVRKGMLDEDNLEPTVHFRNVVVATNLHPRNGEDAKDIMEQEVLGSLNAWLPRKELPSFMKACGAIGIILGEVPEVKTADQQKAITMAQKYVTNQIRTGKIKDKEQANLEYQKRKSELLEGRLLLVTKRCEVGDLVRACFPEKNSSELLGVGRMLELLSDIVGYYEN